MVASRLTVDNYHGYCHFFPITHDLQEKETLFSTFILVSMEICYFPPICWFVLSLFCWDLVDFKLGSLILSSLLASCILGFHQRSYAHDMFANNVLRNSVHYTTCHFDFYYFSQYFLSNTND